MKYKKIVLSLLIASIGFNTSLVYADGIIDNIRYQADCIRQQQSQTINDLNSIYQNINYLEQQKNVLLAQVDDYQKKIITTIATITTIKDDIQKKEAEIVKTEEDLKKAKEEKAVQQEAMKKRMQYIYEQGSNTGLLSTIFQVNNISDIINRIINTQQVYTYDRKQLGSYRAAVSKVEALQKKQIQEKNSLIAMKRGQEEVKAELETLKENAAAQSKDRQDQISYCEGLAAQYQALIDQQNAQILQLQAAEVQAVAAEQARIAAAQQAALQAAAQQQQMMVQVQAEQNYDYQEVEEEAEESYDYNYTYEAPPIVTAPVEEYNEYTEPIEYNESVQSYTPISDGSLGSEIANYATQFVGNPYVWGGTSLTDGADCSGFVQSVFGDYGINLSRTTYTQANEGTPVSYSEMQPGDVINYGFHTAIYLGDNQIVHAADESTGIIISDDPAYQPIVTIRRFV